MKKVLLSLVALCLAGAVSAQTAPVKMTKSQLATISAKKTILTGNETGVSVPTMRPSSVIIGNTIGNTYYDCQSNGAVANKIAAFDDGTVAAVWTASTGSASTRGTGYNYFDGKDWTNPSSYNKRIEDVRTGWAAMERIGEKGEIFVSHNGSDALIIGTRAEKGTGDWNIKSLVGPKAAKASDPDDYTTMLLWPHIATSGNIVHLLACTSSDEGYLYNGIHTALVYFRGTYNPETNEVTWEEPRPFGDLTSSQIAEFNGDSYEVAVNGDYVSMVNASSWSDVILWKSSDGGKNFETKTIIKSPIEGTYSEATTLVLDTPYVVDGTCGIAVDAKGKTHLSFGIYRVLNDEVGDGSYTYFPGINGLLYWNEDMDPILEADTDYLEPSHLDSLGYKLFYRLDLDGDDTAWFGKDLKFAKYGIPMVSTPQLIVDGDNVYMIYTAALDFPFYDASLGYYFRGVFAVKSTDGGKTWEDKTSWLSYNKDCFYIDDWESYDFENYKNVLYVDGESMYPSVARNIVNGKLSMGWQQDYFSGSEIKENNASVAVNSSSIYFTRVDAASIGSYNNTKEIPQGMWTDSTGVADNTLSGMKLYPNPASNNVNIALSSTETGNAILAVYNLMGQMVYSENVALTEGNNLVRVSVSDLNAGVYMINIKTTKGTSTQKLVVR